jgi:serine/threonine protein kinase
VPLAAGSRLGPYEIVAPLSAGGMGEAYRARDTRLGREVAVKILPSAHAIDPESVRRFEKEPRAVASLGIRTSCLDIARFDLARKRPRSLHRRVHRRGSGSRALARVWRRSP